MAELTDDQLKQAVKKWLKTNKRTQKWLAERIGVSHQTMRGMMSSKGIRDSVRKAILIAISTPNESISSSYEYTDSDQRGKFFIQPSEELQALIIEKAALLGISPAVLCTEAVDYCLSSPEVMADLERKAETIRKSREKPEEEDDPPAKRTIA